MSVPVNKIREFEREFLDFMNLKHKDALNDLAAGKLSEEATSAIESTVKELTAKYK